MAENQRIDRIPDVLTLLVREVGAYSPRRSWGAFDSLALRSVDDLYFPDGIDSKTVYAFTVEPSHDSGVVAVAMPTAVLLERMFFHLAQPTTLMLDEPNIPVDAAPPQQEFTFKLQDGVEPRRRIARTAIPELAGSLAIDPKDDREPLRAAERAFRQGSLFESYALARRARVRDGEHSGRAWFFELYAFSFFGAAEDALALYDEYPERGSADAHVQLLAARYRVLLKQFNEARTILHTVSFHDQLGVYAQCELARSYLIDKNFARAIDVATTAIERDRQYVESYLVRGLARRALSYDAGDRGELEDAYKDFERVARQGGYSAPEASYHAGTVLARLGALEQAEQAFRQSLFQRDRLSARDALIRVLCAQERSEEAQEELRLLALLAPQYAQGLHKQLGSALQREPLARSSAQTPSAVRSCTELWDASPEDSVQAARALLSAWRVPLKCTVSDCALLDELINRFAPDGDFPQSGEFSALRIAGQDMVARAIALHIGGLLVEEQVASWGAKVEDGVVIISQKEGATLPLERFVSERILLGASGDNFSSLESIAIEAGATLGAELHSIPSDWWQRADTPTQQTYADQASWAQSLLERLGVRIVRELQDLDELDRLFDTMFEPGGVPSDEFKKVVGDHIERFIVGVGFVVGGVVSSYVRAEWFMHDRPEGISLFSYEMGRLFPIAKVQRRAYLASAADFTSKLGGLAWGIAAASVTEGIREGSIKGAEQVRAALVSRLPRIDEFPEAELAGVVDSLLIGASLK